jgi:hypothetical protein
VVQDQQVFSWTLGLGLHRHGDARLHESLFFLREIKPIFGQDVHFNEATAGEE